MTLEPVLVVLLATSFTCVGLLSLWAAGRRGIGSCAAVFLAVLSPLLLLPAYEPFVAFALQGTVVACGAAAGDGGSPGDKNPKRPPHKARQPTSASRSQLCYC